MILWKPYLAYVDDLISKALIQAASTRYIEITADNLRFRENRRALSANKFLTLR